VHILDGRIDGVLLKEIFSNLGSGTMVYSNRYSGIRPMRQNDISEVLRVIKPFVQQGILIPRSEETLAETYGDYIVFEVDGAIHATAALHRYSGEGEAAAGGCGEIAAIADLMAGLLGWTADERRRQVADYAAKVQRHRPGYVVPAAIEKDLEP